MTTIPGNPIPGNPTPPRARASRPTLAAFALLALAGVPAFAQPASVTWRAKVGFDLAPAPAAADLDFDGDLDLVLVSRDNRIAVHSPSRRRVLWEARLDYKGTIAAIAPAIFVSGRSLDLLVVGSDGAVLLLDGRSGSQVAAHSLGFEPVGSPATYPLAPPDDPASDHREGAAFLSGSGRFKALEFGENGVVTERADATLDGLFKEGPATAFTGWSAPAPHLVAVSGRGAVHLVSPAGGQKISRQVPAAVPFNDSWFAVGDMDGDGKDDVVVADGIGSLRAVGVQDDGLRAIWPMEASIGRPTGRPVLVDVDGDARADALIPKDKQFLLIDGASGSRERIWTTGAYNHDKDIAAPPAIVRMADGRPIAILGEAGGTLCALDLRGRAVLEGGRVELGQAPKTDPIAGAVVGGGRAMAFALGWEDGVGSLVDFGFELRADGAPWLGVAGGPWRTSAYSSRFEAFRQARSARMHATIEARVAEARSLAEKGDWKPALAAAVAALELSPFDEQAGALRRSAWIRVNLILLLAGGLVALAALGAIGFLAGRVVLRDLRVKKARKLLAAADTTGAATIMRAVWESSTGKRAHLKSLVELYLNLAKFDEEALPVFEQAHREFPDEPEYHKGLARSYRAAGRTGPEAAPAYEFMIRLGDDVAEWAFALGECRLAAGEKQEALKAFRVALVEGLDTPELHRRLADLYVALGIGRSDVLPTLRRALPDRLASAPFLRLYCESTQVARVYDEDAERAARALLALEPASPEAHLVLASRYLQVGRVKESMKHAEALLQRDPNDSIGLRLLGQCYAAEDRLDGTAMGIFQKVLAANPEANEILLAVSKGYIKQGREDAEAEQIYRRALKGNPEDTTLLDVVGDLAARQTDDPTTIVTGEKLIALGVRERKVVLRLADAYCRAGVVEPRAESVYREALTYVPDHATVALNLARILAAAGRTDADSLAVYRMVYERRPEALEVARAYAMALAAAEMQEQALGVAEKVLARSPDDGEMKKLAAVAAESLDRMDSAIQGYEQVLERAPDDSEAVVRLAGLYARKRATDERAQRVLQKAAKLKGDDRELHAALARAWAERKDWDQVVATVKHFLSHAPTRIGDAIAILEEISEQHPLALPLRWFLVDTLIYDGRLSDATRHLVDLAGFDADAIDRVLDGFDRILDKNPRDAAAHHQRGRILLNLKRFSEARLAFELAHKHKPTDENVARDLADLYERLLERADSAEVRFQLGKLAMRLHKHDLAIACFQKTAKDYRWENSSIKLLSQCFMARGMLDLALQELRKLTLDDEVKELLYELGQRYEAVADARGAREAYKIIFADDIGYRDVKGKLESLDASRPDILKAERTAIVNSLPDQAKGRYQLVEELGRGAMGIVYRAHDRELDEHVALKILPETMGNNAEAVRRFKTEARNARHLSHPNIVRIHDIGEELGRRYISMEFVDGINLKDRLIQTNRRLPYPETLSYSRQIAAAMIAAHDAGIVHRDIKPANIMITRDGKVKVADFGIAKAIQDESRGALDATKAGAVIGTPLYMSPEQVQGTGVDYRSDIYSLGIVFYEMASGMPPFTEGDLAYHHVFTEPPPIQGADPRYAAIALKCLAKKPEQRYQNVREIFEDLKKIGG